MTKALLFTLLLFSSFTFATSKQIAVFTMTRTENTKWELKKWKIGRAVEKVSSQIISLPPGLMIESATFQKDRYLLINGFDDIDPDKTLKWYFYDLQSGQSWLVQRQDGLPILALRSYAGSKLVALSTNWSFEYFIATVFNKGSFLETITSTVNGEFTSFKMFPYVHQNFSHREIIKEYRSFSKSGTAAFDPFFSSTGFVKGTGGKALSGDGNLLVHLIGSFDKPEAPGWYVTNTKSRQSKLLSKRFDLDYPQIMGDYLFLRRVMESAPRENRVPEIVAFNRFGDQIGSMPEQILCSD